MAKKRKYNVRRKGDPSIGETGVLDEIKDAVVVDVIIPTTVDFLRRIAKLAVDEGYKLTKGKLFPYLKLKFRQAVPVVKAKFKAFKARFKNRKRKKKKLQMLMLKLP